MHFKSILDEPLRFNDFFFQHSPILKALFETLLALVKYSSVQEGLLKILESHDNALYRTGVAYTLGLPHVATNT